MATPEIQSSIEMPVKTEKCGSISDSDPGSVMENFTTYKRRWAVLSILSLLIMSNSLARIACSPVAYTSAKFYKTEVNTINWFAIVYMVVGISCGPFITWVMNKMGMRYSLLLASWLNCVGAVLRICSAIPEINDSTMRLVLVFAGHVLSALAQPFFMFAPSKVAAVWFPDHQRTIANTLATTCNPLGILLANVLSPILVQKPDDILQMLSIYAAPTAIGAILTTACVRSNAPPQPPSASAQSISEPFWIGIKKLAKNRQYWIFFVTIGGGIGIYTAITVFLEQILCPWGYSDFFAGVVCGTCLVLGGMLGAVIAGAIADRTKKFLPVAKVSYFLCMLSVIFFTLIQNKYNQPVLVALSVGLIGFFGMPLLPLGNELVVESTYPVEAATSTGLVFLSGQIQGMILSLIIQDVAKPLPGALKVNAKCFVDEHHDIPAGTIRDMTIPCYVVLGFITFMAMAFVFLTKRDYRRMTMERTNQRRNDPA